jgi:xanthine dehydrogenase/oxidase
MVIIDISRVAEIHGITQTAEGVQFGSTVTLQAMIVYLQALLSPPVPADPQFEAFPAFIRHLNLIANTQVRSAGSWAGNLRLAATHVDFPSDFLTLGSAYRCTVQWGSPSGTKIMDFPTAVRYTPAADEVLLNCVLPWGQHNQFFDSYKVAARHQNAHALVNGAFNVFFDPQSGLVSDASIIFGGVQRGLLSCDKTVAALLNQPWNAATLAAVLPILEVECTPGPDPPLTSFLIASPAYRCSLATTLFFKFFITQYTASGKTLPARLVSAAGHFERPVSSGVQAFVPDPSEAPVSDPIPKLSGILQTSGEAKYSNDEPIRPGTVFAAYVMSSQPVGTIQSIDASAALAVHGVVAFFSASDIARLGGVNSCGMFPGDEEVWASTSVGYVGQPIGIVVADTPAIAEKAAKLVQVAYGAAAAPPIFSIQEAIAANSYLVDNQYISHLPNIISGDVDKGFAASDFVLDGVFETGFQAHFYMETQTAVAHWEENDVLRVYSSTQGAADCRATVATVLNVPANKVIVCANRMGGAFGGKLTRGRPVAASVALAAKILRRPVRMQLSRNDDLTVVGKRHPFLVKYKVGVKKDGTLVALHTMLYSNGGFNYDTTLGCTDMSQLWADNTYFWPNWKSEGFCCKTNLPPNTAMRTPGAFQSIFFIEQILERVAATLSVPSKFVREKNFYQENQVTPYGQKLVNVTLNQVWAGLLSSSDYANRLAAIATFNTANRWVKKGIRAYIFILSTNFFLCQFISLHTLSPPPPLPLPHTYTHPYIHRSATC